MLKNKKIHTKQLLSIFAGGLLTAGAWFSYAAPGELADQPLSSVASVTPNFLLMLDDSGSMAFHNLISREAQVSHNTDIDGDTTLENVRFFAFSDGTLYQNCVGYNTLAYNPNVKYEAWQAYTADHQHTKVLVDGQLQYVASDFATGHSDLETWKQSELQFHAEHHADHAGFKLFEPGKEGNYGKAMITQYRGDSVSSGSLGSVSQDIRQDFYIDWVDADNDGKYDSGECGPTLSGYDSAYQPGAANFIKMIAKSDDPVHSGVIETTSTTGVFTDTNSDIDSKYIAGEYAKLIINVPDTAAPDEIYFRVNFLDIHGNDAHELKVSAVDATDTAIPNGIEMIKKGNGTLISSGSSERYSRQYYYDSSDGIYEIKAVGNFGTSGAQIPSSNDIVEFKAKSNKVIIELITGTFDANTNASGGRGFSIAWHHASELTFPTSGDPAIPINVDGVLTINDCDASAHCVRFIDLPDTEADVASGPTPTKPYNTKENYATWYSFYRNRENIAKKALSDLVFANQYRMGFTTINDTGVGGMPIHDVSDELDGDKTEIKNKLLEKIYKIGFQRGKPSAPDGTQLIRALENAGRYFTQGQDPETSFFGTVDHLATEAVPHSHDSTEEGARGDTLDRSPIFEQNIGGQCQQNFTLLFTDGAWTDQLTNSAVGNIDSDYNDDSNDETGDTELYDIYGGGAYEDTYSGTLADTALYYFANDLAPETFDAFGNLTSGLVDELAVDLHGEEITHQHMVTFGVGLGVSGYKEADPPNYVDAFAWWSNGDGNGDGNNDGVLVPTSDLVARIDDLRHAGYNSRGGYGSAGNLEELQQQLDNVIAEIAARVGNTAAGASFSSIELFSEQGFRYDVSYDTSTWWGDLKAFEFDPSLDNFKTDRLWSAEEKLRTRLEDNTKGHTDRKIITFNGNNGVPFRFPANHTTPTTDEISTTQVSDLLINAGSLDSTAQRSYGLALLNYLRGDFTYDGADGTNGTYPFRDRQGHYLGGLVHSRPQYVGAPSANYPDDIEGTGEKYSVFSSRHENRRHMVYVGGNDGMLHGFYAANDASNNADTSGGEEVFAYIPSFVSNSALGGNLLSTYATETTDGSSATANYRGQAYVDGTPVIADVYVTKKTDADPSVKRWRTYLVGGMRSGAKGIYVLDVTNPNENISHFPKLSEAETTDNAKEIVVKEFTHPDLGYVYGQPKIAKMNNGRWAAIVPNGYNSNDGSANGGIGGSASLFIIYLDDDQDTGDTVTDSDNDGIFNNGQSDYSIITVTSQWVHCAREGGTCEVPVDTLVRYGADGSYVTRSKLGGSSVACDNDDQDPNTTDDFGDPIVNVVKNCEYLDANGLSESTIVDTDGDGDIDRIYAGDLRGNLWVFKTEETGDTGAATWATHAGTDSFGYAKPFFTSCSVTDIDTNPNDDIETYVSDLAQPNTDTFGRCPAASTQAITSAPLIRKNPLTNDDSTAPNYLVFFGTGQYLVQGDKSNANTRTHHFYGIWDAGETNSHNDNITTSNLVKQTISTISGSNDRTIDGKVVDYDIGASPNKELGWYHVLPVTKERVILSPLLIGRNLAYVTLVPVPGNCNPSAGDSYLMAVNPLTGGSPLGDPFGSSEGEPVKAGIKLTSVVVGLSGIKTATGSKIVATQADSVNKDYKVVTSSSTGLTDAEAGNTWEYKGRKSWSILK